jgi:hypothetical protein
MITELIYIVQTVLFTRSFFFFSYPSYLFFSRETFTAVQHWLTDARTLATSDIVVMLVGNKKDLEV